MSATFDENVKAISDAIDLGRRALQGSIDRIAELETALNRMVLNYENTLSESEGKWPQPDSGCIDCTCGTVPDKFNTGRCAYHNAKVLLGQL